MFKNLLPKEEKYFEDFNEMMKHIDEMAVMAHKLFSAETPDKSLILSLKSLEKRCDEVASKVTKRLNKTYITPFDREDIFSLVKKIDDIGDILMAAAVRTDIFHLTEKVEGAEKLTAIIVQQIKELSKVIADLKNKEKDLNECKAVKDLESEADNIYRTYISKLFKEECNPVTLIKNKEILDILENAADKCQSTANVLISIFIKNS